eukprot:6346542-Pyramimonas_sp.AAC.1
MAPEASVGRRIRHHAHVLALPPGRRHAAAQALLLCAPRQPRGQPCVSCRCSASSALAASPRLC